MPTSPCHSITNYSVLPTACSGTKPLALLLQTLCSHTPRTALLSCPMRCQAHLCMAYRLAATVVPLGMWYPASSVSCTTKADTTAHHSTDLLVCHLTLQKQQCRTTPASCGVLSRDMHRSSLKGCQQQLFAVIAGDSAHPGCKTGQQQQQQHSTPTCSAVRVMTGPAGASLMVSFTHASTHGSLLASSAVN